MTRVLFALLTIACFISLSHICKGDKKEIDSTSNKITPKPDKVLIKFLYDMYKSHGANAKIEDSWVSIANGKIHSTAYHFNHAKYPNGLFLLQADFITRINEDQSIVESFAGHGSDLNSALKDACESYQDCTFHALFSALLGQNCSHAETKKWVIGESKRKVTFGSMKIRGKFDSSSWKAIFPKLETKIQKSNLKNGLHWVRFFYMNIPNHEPSVEVLLDNNEWKQLQTEFRELPWPRSNDPYSVRLFCVIDDLHHNTIKQTDN